MRTEKHVYIALNRSLHTEAYFREKYDFTQVYDEGLDREQKNVK